jgi:hypothetical protein
MGSDFSGNGRRGNAGVITNKRNSIGSLKGRGSIGIALLNGFRSSQTVKFFYTGPVISAEMLIAMLEKHGIIASQEFFEPGEVDPDDLNRPANVFVTDDDYDRAYQLFYNPREDEL